MVTETDVYDFLRSVFKTVFERDVIPTAALTAQDVVGWDSLKQVEIVLALQEKYDIRIRTRELNNVANVGDLVSLVLTKTGTPA